jgi:protein-tyrosine phosphatase
MRQAIAKAGLAKKVHVDSAGTGSWHAGEPPDPRTREAAAKRGLVLDHLARQFTNADLDKFEIVIAMDRRNLSQLKMLVGERKKPIVALLRSYDPTAPAGAEVPDPYQMGAEGFEEVLDICERACAGLLAHVQSTL